MIYALLFVTLTKTTIIHTFHTSDRCLNEMIEYNKGTYNRGEIFLCRPLNEVKK